jgi:TRAP-type C4-dicarboxylate transport system substrate-binding protein
MLIMFAACGSAPASSSPDPVDTSTPADETGRDWDFSDAPKVNLVFATYLPDTDPTTLDMLRYLDLVKEYSEGTIDYTMYANQTLCSGTEELEALRNGLCDIIFFPTAYGSGLMPLSYMIDYPGIQYESQMALAHTIKEWFEVVRPDEVSDLKLLFAYGQSGGVYATNSPIRTFEDFKGKQIRCTAALTVVLEAYGAIPTTMVIGEVYEALRTGIVDGHYGIASAVNSQKIWEVTKYVLPDPFFIGTYELFMNMDVWNSLTPDQQAAFEAAVEDGFDSLIAPGREKENAEALETFENAGLEINHFSDEDLAKMAAANGPIKESYAAGVEGGLEALDTLKELAAKYNAMYPD